MGRHKKVLPYTGTMTAEEIKIRTAEAKVKLAEAKAVSEAVKAKQAQLDYDKECGEIVYLNSALEEFNAKISPIMAIIRSLPSTLSNELTLNPSQHLKVQYAVDKILQELSLVEFVFETSSEVDARAAADHTAKAGKKIQRG